MFPDSYGKLPNMHHDDSYHKIMINAEEIVQVLLQVSCGIDIYQLSSMYIHQLKVLTSIYRVTI